MLKSKISGAENVPNLNFFKTSFAVKLSDVVPLELLISSCSQFWSRVGGLLHFMKPFFTSRCWLQYREPIRYQSTVFLNNATNPEYISCYGCAWSYTSRLLFVDIVSASVWVLSVERVPWKEFILYTWLQKEVFCAGCGAKVKVRDSPEHLMIIQRREEKAWRRSEPPGDQSENILHCLRLWVLNVSETSETEANT